MRILKNRVVISLLVILVVVYFWEFWIKPVTGPIYTEAVREYKNRNYRQSLRLLQQATRVDPNDTAILALLGWNYLKLGDPKAAEEPYFRRAHDLAPHVVDITLGYAYTEIALGKGEVARQLLDQLRQAGVDSADVHVAEGAYHRQQGRYREAAREFKVALERDEKNAVATQNLQELLNSTDVRGVNLEAPSFQRPTVLTYPAHVQGDYLAWLADGHWQPTYLIGVDLTAALPGSFPADAVTDPAVYRDWFARISDLGANTVRLSTLLPPAFYRALREFNSAAGQKPLWLLQGIPFADPPRSDMFDGEYFRTCQKSVRDTIDVIHGQGDVPAGGGHAGGVYTDDVAPWVTGLLVGQAWPSHIVTGNNLLHPDIQTYQGTYIEVPSGSPAEVFLAQMINTAAEYEEGKYNWQHPVAFINWPTLDPIRHPTESTLLEEVSIRRAQGERLPAPSWPFDDDDGVSLDPTHLRPHEGFVAGYFSAYSVLPYYPDFLNQDPRYQAVRDAEGSNPFLGYLRDLKAYHPGLPLVVADYGIPSSLGIGHFSPAGFAEGGKTEPQQGQLLARLTRSVREAGAAGGTVLEWLDQWHRLSWIQRDYETPPERRTLWENFMNPAEHFGLLAADSHLRKARRLSGDRAEFASQSPFYAKSAPGPAQPVGDQFDPARDLKALYMDADEAFLYLRLVVGKLDNDNDGQPDWKDVNYLIGLGTAPNVGGITYLPFITPVRFPAGMNYAIQLTGPASSRIWIASTYSPFKVAPVEGIPTQTTLAAKLGWKPSVSASGDFEAQIIEPNRRRFGRDGKYFPPQRYERGILRYGTLTPQAADYDTLAEWHANVQTNTIDLRIPWNLLNVTDPSSFKVFAGLEADGTVITAETPGFLVAAFSYRPLASARLGAIMEQGHPVADALPPMTGPATIESRALKQYRWEGWNAPRYDLRLKDSYAILRKVFQSLPASPPATHERPSQAVAQGGSKTPRSPRKGGAGPSGR
ncbi:MAG: tetratricopeptide repeat protein [Acidobacteriia bacterium]|nr:tetratricopeptide repeat protein [Terriglobia bacterium]